MRNPTLEIDNNLPIHLGFAVGAILGSAFWWFCDGFNDGSFAGDNLLIPLVVGFVSCWLGGGIIGAEFCWLTNRRPRTRQADRRRTDHFTSRRENGTDSLTVDIRAREEQWTNRNFSNASR